MLKPCRVFIPPYTNQATILNYKIISNKKRGPSYVGTIGGIGPGRYAGQIDQQYIAPLFHFQFKYLNMYICICIQVASGQPQRAVIYIHNQSVFLFQLYKKT